jgi:hypothetical protein
LCFSLAQNFSAPLFWLHHFSNDFAIVNRLKSPFHLACKFLQFFRQISSRISLRRPPAVRPAGHVPSSFCPPALLTVVSPRMPLAGMEQKFFRPQAPLSPSVHSRAISAPFTTAASVSTGASRRTFPPFPLRQNTRPTVCGGGGKGDSVPVPLATAALLSIATLYLHTCHSPRSRRSPSQRFHLHTCHSPRSARCSPATLRHTRAVPNGRAALPRNAKSAHVPLTTAALLSSAALYLHTCCSLRPRCYPSQRSICTEAIPHGCVARIPFATLGSIRTRVTRHGRVALHRNALPTHVPLTTAALLSTRDTHHGRVLSTCSPRSTRSTRFLRSLSVS